MWPFTKRIPTATPKRYPDCEFDIEGVPVISIERDTQLDQTLIGYRASDGTLEEWLLPVSPQAHDAFVRRFRAKLGLTSATSSTP
jgi:hypothetical protein